MQKELAETKDQLKTAIQDLEKVTGCEFRETPGLETTEVQEVSAVFYNRTAYIFLNLHRYRHHSLFSSLGSTALKCPHMRWVATFSLWRFREKFMLEEM